MTLHYELNEQQDGLVVTGGEDIEGEVIIPSEETFEGKKYPVKEIDNWAFKDCEAMESLVIPNSVTKIGSGAFNNCWYLERVVIPDTITRFEEFTFSDCYSLKHIFIPASVTEIENNVFDGCGCLSSMVVAEDNPVYDSREGCNAIIETAINELIAGCYKTIIPDSVIVIGKWAFNQCYKLEHIDIPESVKVIDERAFQNCNLLEHIEIPASVFSIEEGVFSGCKNLSSIKVSKDNLFYDSREDCNAIIETASNCLIIGCRNTMIPDSVTDIGICAFQKCEGLENITIPDSVVRIGRCAFLRCENLKSIVLPKSLKEIEYQLFSYCINLESIVIPDSVTEIDNLAFKGCCSLKSIVIPDSVRRIGTRAFDVHYFSKKYELESIYINDASLLDDAWVPITVKILGL